MKARFEGELILRYLDEPVDGKWFEVIQAFAYIGSDAISIGMTTVPKGVKTDFASIPRGFRWIIARVGKYGKAAVLHDYICEAKIGSRKYADRVFLDAMKTLGVGWWKRRTMYAGVRAYSVILRKK